MQIWRIRGTQLELVAGNGSGLSPGGGPTEGPATEVPLGGSFADLAFGPDGSLYFTETNLHWVRRVTPEGRVERVAGPADSTLPPATTCTSATDVGDGGPALAALLRSPTGLAIAADGTVYVIDEGHCRVRRIDPEGFISTAFFDPRDALSAVKPSRSIAVGPDESVYFFGSAPFTVASILRLDVDGSTTPIVGRPDFLFGADQDGMEASTAFACRSGERFTFDLEGQLICIDAASNNVRYVDSLGRLRTLAGNGQLASDPNPTLDNSPGRGTSLPALRDIARSPDGTVYLASFRQIIRLNARHPGTSDDSLHDFDSNGRHLRSADRLTGAELWSFSYLPDGRLAQVVDPSGNVLAVSRPAPNQVLLTAPFGERTLLFDDTGDGYADRIEYEDDPSGEFLQLAYGTGDAEGLLLSFIDRNGFRSDYQYDAVGRLTHDTLLGSTSQSLALNPVERSVRDDGESLVVLQQYSVDHNSGTGLVTRYEAVSHDDGRAERRVTYADGLTSSLVTFPDGQEAIVRRDGTIIQNETVPGPRFGELNRMVRSQTLTLPSGRTRSLSREREVESDPDDAARVLSWTETVTESGRTGTVEYDGSTRTTTATTPGGRSVETVLDVRGRIVELRVPGLHPVTFTYDARGRRDQVNQGPVSDERTIQYIYDANGDGVERSLPEALRYALDQQVTLSYGALGRLTSVVGPDDESVTYRYDANGNVAGVTPPGRSEHAFSYGARDETTSYQPPPVGTEEPIHEWAFDPDLDLTATTLPSGRTITPSYSITTGRLESVAIGRGLVTIGYETVQGNLNRITMPDGQGLQLQADGPLLESMTWTGPVQGTVDFTYATDLRLESIAVSTPVITTPVVIPYSYDIDGLLIAAGPMVATRNAENGFLTGTSVGGVTTTQVVDGYGALTEHGATWTSGGTLFFEDVFDRVGRLQSRTETTVAGGRVFDFTYDVSGRLSDVRIDANLRYHYDYDVHGNRVGWTDPSGSGTAEYDDQDRLIRYGAEAFAYNLDGQLETRIDTGSGAQTSYDYDELGNLLAVDLADGRRIDYRVDGADRRVEKRVDGAVVRRWLYQDALNPIAELNSDGSIRQVFIYGTRGHVPDLILREGDTYRVVTDAVGSVRRVIETATGAVVQTLEYDPFGQVLVDTNPGFQPFAFAGGLYDRDTGLIRFGARDYDPSTGRWTTKDPLLFGGGDTNLYAYAFSDPVNYIDASGQVVCGGLCIGGIIVGATTLILLNPATSTDSGYEGMAVDAALSLAMAPVLSRLGAVLSTAFSNALRTAPRIAKLATKAFRPNSCPTGGAGPVRIGQAGERAVRAANDIGPKVRIEINGRGRVPDGLTDSVLSEVKNVQRLSFTRQLRDFADFAHQTGRRFDLFVRPNTRLSGPLQEAISPGKRINIRTIPE